MQNWVLVQPGAETGVISDAPNTTLDTSFIKPDDPRVIAFTTAVVGSQIAVVTFDAPPPGRYTYLSTAPRHQEMRGMLVVPIEKNLGGLNTAPRFSRELC